MKHLSKEFWSEKYQNESTGWDIGFVSPPIKEYFDDVTNKDASILIPGCGNAYEAEYLVRIGFTDVHVIDLTEEPLNNLLERYPSFPKDHIHVGDFFDHEGQYDYIIEQTLFCAIDPSLRQKYADKAHSLLKPGGILTGVLFGRDFDGGPPYGGNKLEYVEYFKNYDKVCMEPCYNSVNPRLMSELYIEIFK